MTLPKPGPGRPEHPAIHSPVRQTDLREFLGWALVVAGCIVVAWLLSGRGPSQEEQERWANAACKSHKGVAHFDDFGYEGGGGGPANVLCRDGHYFTQLEFNSDSGRGDEFGYETPAEVRTRSNR